MKNQLSIVIIAGTIIFLSGLGCQMTVHKEQTPKWAVHDMNRPAPKMVAPGEQVGQPPADAIVLFNGADLSAWQSGNGNPAPWKVENGYMEVVPKSGAIQTKQGFGDCQLHIEFATPPAQGDGQHRGNSGVFLMNIYEIQVLDSFNNPTYPDGQAGSVYGQNPPMVNVCRGPQQWQAYDIVFHRPRFDKNGKVVTPARVTVFQNGVLVQDNFQIVGATAHKKEAAYSAHADKLPLGLQDHGNPMRFRNVWIRELE